MLLSITASAALNFWCRANTIGLTALFAEKQNRSYISIIDGAGALMNFRVVFFGGLRIVL